MAEEVRTERLLLRRALASDAAGLHRIMSDPQAMAYWSSPPHAEISVTERWLDSMIEAPPESADDFVVTLDGELIGKLGAWRLPEVGFLMAPWHWGRGYALEAMTAFIARRRALGSSELTADVDPRNTASIRLLERAGFRESGRAERTWNVGGVWCDSIYYRLELEAAT